MLPLREPLTNVQLRVKTRFSAFFDTVVCSRLCIHVSDEMQWQVHALEDMQRSLEEDYAFRLSCLVAEQEREQRHHSQVSIGRYIYIYMGSVPNLCELPHVYYIYLGILTKMGPYKFLMDDNYINSCTSAMHELE